jgi:ADP-ribosylglycohydrolase
MMGSLTDTESFRRTLSIAVTHSGDSDSVGAIVGNCLGARWSRHALPTNWLKDLKRKDELDVLAQPVIKHPSRMIYPTCETGRII